MPVPLAEQRKVLQRSGNVCAFPECRRELTAPATDDDPLATLGEIAHIVGEKPTAARGGSPLSLRERNSYPNLVLMCENHHKVIDTQVRTWTVRRLQELKSNHEGWVSRTLNGVDPVTGEWAGGSSAAPNKSDPTSSAVPAENYPLVGSAIGRAVLGIHPAIPLQGEHDAELSTELPAYVARDHDPQLRSLLNDSALGGGFVLLVGSAAVGKSRSAYEAARAMMPDWNLVLPDGEFWRDATRVRSIPAHSVVWVDDIATTIESGELTAGTVRGLLATAHHPVILLGSIWPADYERLTAHPGGGHADVTRSARETLQMARCLPVPAQFSAAERERSTDLAKTDPRINEALSRHMDGSVPTVLACSPELIRRWTVASNPIGAAMISAATDAVLCGHPTTLPTTLLRSLTEKYLTDAQRASANQDWFTSGLEWACQPVRGTTAMLTAQARTVGQIDGYRITDILVHHAQHRYADEQRVPEKPWNVLEGHVGQDACLSVGMYAVNCGHPKTGERILARAAHAGSAEAYGPLAFALADQGKLEDARVWFERAAEAGQPDVSAMVAVILEEQGDVEGAKHWLQRAINGENDPTSMWGLGQIFEIEGDADTAIYWYRRASETGADGGLGMTCLGSLYRKQGDIDAAAACYEEAATAGSVHAMLNLGLLLADRGALDGAQARFHQAAEFSVEGAVHLGALLRERGDLEGARFWLGRAAASGHRPVMADFGAVLRQLGDIEGARTWFQRGAEAGDVEAMAGLGALLGELGDRPAASTWLNRAAQAGQPIAQLLYSVFLVEQGDITAAREWAQKAEQAGTPMPAALTAALAPASSASHARACTHTSEEPFENDIAQWTPLEHRCSCVVTWGWPRATLNPESILTWCLIAADLECPWHERSFMQSVNAVDHPIIDFKLPTTGTWVCIHKATGDDVQLGRRLGHRIRSLGRLIDRNDKQEIIREMPDGARRRIEEKGLDPAETWLGMLLTDIVLNRGEPSNRATATAMDTDH